MRFVYFMLLAGCATEIDPVGFDPAESDDTKADGGGMPDVRCADDPVVAAKSQFRHRHNRVTAALGGPQHRGIDLITTASGTQVIAGELAYGVFDDGIDDEDVELFACRAGAWEQIGTATTVEHGAFALELHDDARLPIGMRDMFLSVPGDRTSTRFLAVVAPEGTPLAISDVDGTLTQFEAAFAIEKFGIDTGIHDGAPEAFHKLAGRGHVPVYLTARARRSTEETRAWLDKHGMPRGPLRLADGVMLPGSSTVAYKTEVLRALDGFELALGNGNRASDIEAYRAAGIPADRITIKLPEFTLEVRGALDRGEARGFDHYDQLVP